MTLQGKCVITVRGRLFFPPTAVCSHLGPSTSEFFMTIARSLLSTCALFAAITGLAFTSSSTVPAADEFKGDAYPLDTCVVSGEKLGADAVTVVLSGMKDKNLDATQMKFCCAKCEATFKADPSKYTAKLNEQIIKAAGTYALTHCLVMADEKLDGSAKIVVFRNHVYKLCCKKCVGRFEKDPTKYAAAFDSQIIAAQKPGYKAKKCPISGEGINADSTDVVLSDRLVRTCCEKCAAKAKADPKATIAKVDAIVAASEKADR